MLLITLFIFIIITSIYLTIKSPVPVEMNLCLQLIKYAPQMLILHTRDFNSGAVMRILLHTV